MHRLINPWEFFRDLSPLPGRTSADEAAFLKYCARRGRRINFVFGAFILFFALLWWPSDPFIYRDLPACMSPTALWRAGISILFAVYLAVSCVPAIHQHDDVISWFVSIAAAAIMGYASGRMGGLDRPHFHLLYVLAFGTIHMPLRLTRRIILTAAICASETAFFLVPFPAYRHSPYIPLTFSFLVCVTALSILWGEMFHRQLRTNFFQAEALAENARLLEGRVAARTEELRAMLARVETAREDERARIARELHDELGQDLTAQRLILALAEQSFDSEPGLVRRKFAEMRERLDEMAIALRNLVSDLRPRVLDDLGLGAAARWLVTRTEETAGVFCHLRVTGDAAAVDRERTIAAFRVLQESLTNVARHARATEVVVDIEIDAAMLMLRVRDNGVGLSAPAGRRSFGILGMRERVQALGGEFSLAAGPAGGTEMTCRMPHARPAGAAA